MGDVYLAGKAELIPVQTTIVSERTSVSNVVRIF